MKDLVLAITHSVVSPSGKRNRRGARFPCLANVREGITFYKLLEAHTPCAMVMYVMTPPVDFCVRDHTPRASMYTCLYLLAEICVRDFRCQYVIYPYFYVI